MLSRDHVKLLVLLALTVICIGTLFTSQSIAMRNPSMRVLTAGGRNTPQKFCMEPRKAARECEKRTKTDTNDSSKRKENCNNDRLTVQKCEKVVNRAFSDINMGGCPKKIKLMTLCEDEWCHQDPASCQKECAGVRENLSVCIRQRIMHYFNWNGLRENGTTA